MPKIRTHTVSYTISPNRHKLDVNIMYDTGQKQFYVIIPDPFKDAINTMPDEMKDQYNVKSAIGLRGVHGLAIIHNSESELISGLESLFYYCANAIKQVNNVIIIWSKGNSSDENIGYNMGANPERVNLSQSFKFVLAIETKVGVGDPIYTYQGVTYTNTISMSDYHGKPIVIPDTPENRAFLSDVYTRFNNLILNLKKFFENSETVTNLIDSKQLLLN